MKKIKSFKLFESSEEINDIISTVKDMLLELDFLDIETSCKLSRAKDGTYSWKIATGYDDVIVIELLKPSISGFVNISGTNRSVPRHSFELSDISDVIDNIKDYLESEGFKLDRISPITFSSVQAVSSLDDGLYSRCEIRFLR